VRIGLVAPPWTPVPPVAYGGTELVVDQLARNIGAAGHEVVLVTTGDSTCPVPTVATMPFSQGERIGAALPELLHALAARDAVAHCDVVHDHTLALPLLAGGQGGPPVLTTIHGTLEGDLAALYRRLHPSVGLIGISRAQMAAAPDLRAAAVIHHGVDAAAFPEGAGDGGYLLFLGRMGMDKGAHRALHAAHLAGMPLLIAGKMREADERAYYDRYVAPYLNSELRYLGEVDHAEKLALLAGAAALLFPIRWNEPFGLVMIEALACGTPVLAFPEGAAVEVVDDGRTGWLCRDEHEMAAAIGRIGQLDRRACRRAVQTYFSADRMVAEHLAVYQQVLEGGRAPAPA
jgi:glycosyltransferase involved in cell wall biosynthesis